MGSDVNLATRSDGDAGLSIIGLRLADGRTVSTLAMQLLGTAPEITFDRRYPAEYRWASYFGRMAEQITTPFDPDEHLGVTPFFFGSRPAWGPAPFQSDVVDVASLRSPLLRALWCPGPAARRLRLRPHLSWGSAPPSRWARHSFVPAAHEPLDHGRVAMVEEHGPTCVERGDAGHLLVGE
jgi:hypothetical protein